MVSTGSPGALILITKVMSDIASKVGIKIRIRLVIYFNIAGSFSYSGAPESLGIETGSHHTWVRIAESLMDRHPLRRSPEVDISHFVVHDLLQLLLHRESL